MLGADASGRVVRLCEECWGQRDDDVQIRATLLSYGLLTEDEFARRREAFHDLTEATSTLSRDSLPEFPDGMDFDIRHGDYEPVLEFAANEHQDSPIVDGVPYAATISTDDDIAGDARVWAIFGQRQIPVPDPVVTAFICIGDSKSELSSAALELLVKMPDPESLEVP